MERRCQSSSFQSTEDQRLKLISSVSTDFKAPRLCEVNEKGSVHQVTGYPATSHLFWTAEEVPPAPTQDGYSLIEAAVALNRNLPE